MVQATIQRVFGLGERPAIGRWLQFAPPLQARYDADHGAARAAELRSAILLGLCFYNVYSLTALLLMPDIAALGIGLRLGFFTPLMAALAWAVRHLPPVWNERLIFGGILGAQGFPVWQFWLTESPLGLLTFGELFLCIVYANMLLALRFRYAAAFSACALAMTLLAILLKPGLSSTVQLAFTVQIVTAAAFALCGNYRVERRRCADYVSALGATLEAQQADAARRTFEDLSRTDALTGLPNRRHLSETIDAWWSTPGDLALMMIDIDHFKPYNDRLGHPAGDECLCRVADALAAAAHGGKAFCARFGGEEFAVIARVEDEADAVRWARRLVRAVRVARIPHPARPDDLQVVTVSVGAASGRRAGVTSPASLLARADAALYAAKTKGRNGFAIGETVEDMRRAS
ncbi:diguanylate cyclase domain-containing protein [Aureimonas ureilytica]|uniref:GGDEF domain-containing protein n=1 Tax=Aureimonas ureilytica TaxID=401562 RepID=UPI003CF199FF